MIFATNEERNGDLNAASSRGREKYSSLEDGEVRDDDEDSAGDDAEAARGSYSNGNPGLLKRVSESEILDEDNFFYGGGGSKHVGEMVDFEGGPNVFLSDKDENGYHDLRQDEDDEPMASSTLNPFKFSGRNLPTETEKYESSVYQTPELNPSLNDSLKQYPINSNGSQ